MTRKSILTVVAGIVMVMASIWFGSYFIYHLESRHWAIPPTFLTSFFTGVVGFALIAKELH